MGAGHATYAHIRYTWLSMTSPEPTLLTRKAIMFAVIASSLALAQSDLTRNCKLENADASGDWKVWAKFDKVGQACVEADYVARSLGVPCRVMRSL